MEESGDTGRQLAVAVGPSGWAGRKIIAQELAEARGRSTRFPATGVANIRSLRYVRPAAWLRRSCWHVGLAGRRDTIFFSSFFFAFSFELIN